MAAGGGPTPWAVRAGILTFVSEVPLGSGGSRDRSFAVADMMAGMFGPAQQRHRALIRLEDVGPAADPLQLRQVADLLAARGIPFSVAVYPVYAGPVTQHPRQWVRLRDRPQVVDAIRYMLSRGGTLILHGYTHQLADTRNPDNGESGEDYEFLRVRYDARHVLLYDNPVANNSAAWARNRINMALAAIRAAGLPRPELWQFPEYGASPAEYRVAASMFIARFERGNYAAGPPGHEDLQTLTEQTPPYLVRDIYGGPVLPETLGYVIGPHVPATGPGSVSEILAAAAVQKAAVRDNIAGVYYHPFLGTGPLRRLVDGLRQEGYRFVSPCAVLKG
jgi:predicted deacetylase